MKMLMFDFRDSEKDFFDKNEFPDFDITFIKEPLNEMSQLTKLTTQKTTLQAIQLLTVGKQN